MQKSIIEELYSDSGPVNAQLIVSAIKSFIKVQREGNKIFLSEKGIASKSYIKILVYGLTKKLLKLEATIEAESISAKEVSEELNVKKGSVDPTFSVLRKKGFIIGSGTNYTIPNDKILKIVEILNNYKENTNEQ